MAPWLADPQERVRKFATHPRTTSIGSNSRSQLNSVEAKKSWNFASETTRRATNRGNRGFATQHTQGKSYAASVFERSSVLEICHAFARRNKSSRHTFRFEGLWLYNLRSLWVVESGFPMTTPNSLMTFWVPVGSLIVAAVAVFVGPLISLRVAKRQTETALAVAQKQVIAPMRQKWIDSLRDRVAKFVSTPAKYQGSGVGGGKAR